MGIDAEILLRINGPKPTENQIKAWGWQIASTIGSDKFFIDKEQGHGAISLSCSRYREDDVVPGTLWTQDGPDIEAAPGETFLEVHVWTRYYGIGYERGDLLTLCAIAEWCEANIPNCAVWYGGDSSGVCAKPWPDEQRRALRQHLYSPNGRDYFGGWNGLGNRTGARPPRPDPCSLCVGAGDFNECGWGGRGNAPWLKVHCSGCGEDFETTDNGVTWNKVEEKKAA